MHKPIIYEDAPVRRQRQLAEKEEGRCYSACAESSAGVSSVLSSFFISKNLVATSFIVLWLTFSLSVHASGLK